MTTAFPVGRPGSPIRCWLALKDGRPISKAIINLDRGVAGLYGVVTRPEARGMGLARILTLHGYAAAREAGYKVGVLHSPAMGVNLHEKLGFQGAEPFRVYGPAGNFHI